MARKSRSSATDQGRISAQDREPPPESKNPDITTHIGLEGIESEVENLAFLDVVYESGYSFRLRVHSDLEGSLIERRTQDKSLDQRIRQRKRRSSVYLQETVSSPPAVKPDHLHICHPFSGSVTHHPLAQGLVQCP